MSDDSWPSKEPYENPNEEVDESKAFLEDENASLKARLGRQRFVVALLIVIVVDMHVFPAMQGWSAFSITLLQLVFLYVVAKSNDVREVVELANQVTNNVIPQGTSSPDEKADKD